jgi:hypothetical protein
MFDTGLSTGEIHDSNFVAGGSEARQGPTAAGFGIIGVRTHTNNTKGMCGCCEWKGAGSFHGI